VEHKPETIAIADHVVDLGPGAGSEGGRICFEGSVSGLRGSDTVTGRHLDDRAALKNSVRAATGRIEVRGATAHNVRGVDVDIPLGVLCVVTGVAGSGKSSLIHGSVSPRDGVVAIDQAAIRGSRRSNPATYTGLLEPIRKAFAKANGVKPALFSPNSEGACPTCKGAGVIYSDLAMIAGVATTCDDCEGRRFQAEVLEYRFGGRNIGEVLAMLDRLVDAGKSVIVIEHHQAVMAHADWIIDLGPGAGHDGGRIVFEGTPAELVAGASTLTGEHLARYVAAAT
jgi:excinuclease UvrABC ATPase subunit